MVVLVMSARRQAIFQGDGLMFNTCEIRSFRDDGCSDVALCGYKNRRPSIRHN